MREAYGMALFGQATLTAVAISLPSMQGGSKTALGARPRAHDVDGLLTVRRLAEQAGFKFAGSSEVNANPKDTADWPNGVWTLPPSLNQGDKDRAKYLAIGESDRMTLKFVKPR